VDKELFVDRPPGYSLLYTHDNKTYLITNIIKVLAESEVLTNVFHDSGYRSRWCALSEERSIYVSEDEVTALLLAGGNLIVISKGSE